MSYVDPYRRSGDRAGWPPPESAGDAGDDPDATQRGRHRARHAAAAPDPYPPEADPYPLPDGYPVPPPPVEGYPDRPPPVDYHRSAPVDDYFRGPHTGTARDRSTAQQAPSPYPVTGATTADASLSVLADGGRTGRPRSRRGHDRYDLPAGAAVGGSAARDAPDGAGPARRKTGRAGRNLPAAIGVSVVLGAAVLSALLLWKPAFLGVVVVAVCAAIWELSRAVRHSGAHPPLVPLLIGGVLMPGVAWYEGPDALCVGLLGTVLAALVWRLADGPDGYQRDIAAATLVVVYVPFLGGFAALLAVPDDGPLRVLATLAAVVLSDTGGYVSGVFFGRHPMAPKVSPKKSWEGFAGSLLATAAGSAVLLYFLLGVPAWWGALFGLGISAVAVLGDLAESMLKRDLGIKDMSNLLPGHGGLMDRLDSILFALPTGYLLLSVLARPAG